MDTLRTAHLTDQQGQVTGMGMDDLSHLAAHLFLLYDIAKVCLQLKVAGEIKDMLIKFPSMKQIYGTLDSAVILRQLG